MPRQSVKEAIQEVLAERDDAQWGREPELEPRVAELEHLVRDLQSRLRTLAPGGRLSTLGDIGSPIEEQIIKDSVSGGAGRVVADVDAGTLTLERVK